MNKTPLEQKKCQPCEGAGDPFNVEQAMEQLKNVEGWKLSADGKGITRRYISKNFMAAVNFIQKVAQVAESEDHHPDIHLTGYRTLTIDLSTHAIGGLSENDFIVAAKINGLPIELKG
jgi:4a-hydroxytetrahydrobiopterin dehydratase